MIDFSTLQDGQDSDEKWTVEEVDFYAPKRMKAEKRKRKNVKNKKKDSCHRVYLLKSSAGSSDTQPAVDIEQNDR